MLYCEKCMLLAPDNVCSSCKNRNVRDVKENDPVYLTTKDAIWSGVIEDMLTKNNIPYLKNGFFGAGITSTMGYSMEMYKFFVPFGAYKKSKELLSDAFIDEVSD